jgi:dihydrofolate reductase
LPGRHNIILSSNPALHADGCETVTTPEAALQQAQPGEVMVIGGAMVYRWFLPLAHTLYLTLIHHSLEGDTRFPDWRMEEWQERQRSPIAVDMASGLRYSFIRLERRQQPGSG